ncbi:MAG: hypothetical protein LAT64_08500 [Phycisphaerales bacterium]|nr:hypothetical protein [Planctomycetota bacterium]MCH8508790.1 hypothetical protein [Phycisphaerales bacterium]
MLFVFEEHASGLVAPDPCGDALRAKGRFFPGAACSADPCPMIERDAYETTHFENDQVNASDLAAWLEDPFEVNMDGRICSDDFALMSSAYEPE